MTIIDQLTRDEGLRLKPYRDTVGKWTIGVGRNLSDVGITVEEANTMLRNDVERIVATLRSRLPYFNALDPGRQGVLVNMAFNLGFSGLEQFQDMLHAVAQGRWDDAAAAMLSSKWADEVGDRAKRLAHQLQTGEWT